MIRKDQDSLRQLLQLGLVVVVSVCVAHPPEVTGGGGLRLPQLPHPPSSPELPGEPGARSAETAHQCHHRSGGVIGAGPYDYDYGPRVFAEEVRLVFLPESPAFS